MTEILNETPVDATASDEVVQKRLECLAELDDMDEDDSAAFASLLYALYIRMTRSDYNSPEWKAFYDTGITSEQIIESAADVASEATPELVWAINEKRRQSEALKKVG